MSAVRSRRRGGGHDADEHPDERWMASYMDMITVLMCMFIVLYAMSTVDQDKYIALRNSLATGFGQTEVGAVDTASGTVVPLDEVTDEGEGYAVGDEDATSASATTGSEGTAEDLARAELDDLTAIKDAIATNLASSGLASDVEFAVDARGLTVRLVGSETFFGSNSADLSDEARRVMDAVSPVLRGAGHDVSVEGHADQRTSVAPFATNWELSSARATQVLRDLVERGQLDGAHVQAVGFGSSRPVVKGGSDADLATNRRVDIVVLSNQSDTVSALLPELQAAVTGAGGTVPAGDAGAVADAAGAGTSGTETVAGGAPAETADAEKASPDEGSGDDHEGAQSGGH